MNYFKITDPSDKKTSEIIADMKKMFCVYSYYDTDKLDRDFPAPKKETTRYFNKTVEADEGLKNKSANNLKDIPCITLRERLIMEIEYFKETGAYLDVQNITLCAGSRDSGGGVPNVDWDADYRLVRIGWYGTGGSSDLVRARAIVNPSTLTLESSDTTLENAIKICKENGMVVYKVM